MTLNTMLFYYLRLAWLPLIFACNFITDEEHAARFDQDGDGISWPEDCDDTDPNVGGGCGGDTEADSIGDTDTAEDSGLDTGQSITETTAQDSLDKNRDDATALHPQAWNSQG